MNLLSPIEAIPADGYYELTAAGAAKLILYMAHKADQSDCSPGQQIKNLAAVGKAMSLAKSRGFADGERLVNLLWHGTAAHSALVLSLFDRLFACLPAEEFLIAAGFEPALSCHANCGHHDHGSTEV